jgi:hypothetical protein
MFRYTIGNLGESDNYCSNSTYDSTGDITIQCYDDSSIMNIVQYGLSVLGGSTNCPTGAVQQYNLDLIDTCTYDNLSEEKRSSALDNFYDKCVGEQVCNFNMGDFNLDN